MRCAIRGQATFHPLKYLAGSGRGLRRRNVRFFPDTPVDEVAEENDAVTVKTSRGMIRAAHAVVATNSPIVRPGGAFIPRWRRTAPM